MADTPSILVKPDGAALAEIGGLVDEGKVQVVVTEVFPLVGAPAAHEQISTGHTRGKVVLVTGDPAPGSAPPTSDE